MYNQVELDERDMFKLSDAEKKQKAKEFAEGNAALEELLLFLWNHKSTTYACCGGHKGEFVEIDGEIYEAGGNPYVLVGIENMTDSELQSILGMLCENKEIFLLEVNNDHREEEGARQRKYIDIQLEDANSSMLDVAAVFYGVMQQGYVSDNSKLQPEEKEFIESAVALKNTNIDELDLTGFQKYYKHFPEKAESVIISKIGVGKPKYEVKLRDKHIRIFDSNGLSYVCSKAFYRGLKGETYIVDENAEIVPISNEQIEKLGLISSKKYIEMIHKLFEKDQKALFSLLNSKSQMAIEKQ